MGPLDYSIEVADPFRSALQGFQAGAAIRDDQQQQRALVGQQQAQAQQQQALQQLMQNPTAENYANAVLIAPGYKDQLKQSWDTRNTEQQRNDLSEMGQVYSAIRAKKPEYAAEILDNKAAAMENSGDQRQAGLLRTMATLAKDHPEFVAGQALAVLQSIPGGDKFINGVATAGQEQRANDAAPAGLRKAEADATTAQVTAGNADERATLEKEKIATDINVAKENSRIRAMEVALGKEMTDLKRQELQLKLDDARTARDEKLKAKGAEAETAIADVDNTVGILKDILGDEDTLRAAVGTFAWRGAIPGTKARTMAGKIEQLQNAIASTNLDKLKGAMSDKDIMFLKNIATNLDRYQDEDLFIKELNRVFGALEDARERVVQKYGAAGTPAAEGATVFDNHPKYGKVTERRLRQIARKAGVSAEDAKAFLSNSTDPGQGATGEY